MPGETRPLVCIGFWVGAGKEAALQCPAQSRENCRGARGAPQWRAWGPLPEPSGGSWGQSLSGGWKRWAGRLGLWREEWRARKGKAGTPYFFK